MIKEKCNSEAIHKLGSWSLLICGGKSTQDTEDRSSMIPKYLVCDRKIDIIRANLDKPHEFSLTRDNQIIEIFWDGLIDALARFLHPHSDILLDITSLELETLLYLLSALVGSGKFQLGKLGFVYVSPKAYKDGQEDLDFFKIQLIQQPRGFVSLEAGILGENKKHVLFLGYDGERTNKFISRYDWRWQDIFCFIGDPGLVPDAENVVKRNNKFILSKIHPYHQPISIPASNPYKVRDKLNELFDESTSLDVVPLGPKSFSLGILMFYFNLHEKKRKRVRLLYDFPIPINTRAEGVRDLYYWNWVS